MYDQLIYKLADQALLAELEGQGVSVGSEHDLRDGFIHFSTANQVQGTFDKYFKARLAAGENIWLLAIDVKQLPTASLRFEAPKALIADDANSERSRQLFPHLYAPLGLGAVCKRVQLDNQNVVEQLRSFLAD
jgi:uncharacterized protein (DUF952 family)